MSIIYERTKTKVTNEVYHSAGTVQFQFLEEENCVNVWGGGDIWLMLESGAVNNNGWIRNRRWITIYVNGEVTRFK